MEMKDFKGRSFLKLLDYTPEEISFFLELAADLKNKKKNGIPHEMHRGNAAVHIFALVGKFHPRHRRGHFMHAVHDRRFHKIIPDTSRERLSRDVSDFFMDTGVFLWYNKKKQQRGRVYDRQGVSGNHE